MVINVYVAGPDPDPDPNPRGGDQLPDPNECNSTLTSGTNNIYPYPNIDVNDRGHRFISGSPLRVYPAAAAQFSGLGVGLKAIGWSKVWVRAHREAFTKTISTIMFISVLC